MVVSTLKVARKRTGKIRSNLHTGKCAGSIFPGHSQGQTLVPGGAAGAPRGRQTHRSTSFFEDERPLKKGAVDLPYTPVVSIATG